MPSFRVEGRSLSLKEFDVLGTDGSHSCFIAHAGLAESDATHEVEHIPIVDMGPPLHGLDRAAKIAVHAVGRADLEFPELQKIRNFIARHAGEHASFLHVNASAILRHAPEMYSIRPHAEPFFEEDGRYSRTRFSCAGFALEAYKSARIPLVNVDNLPPIEMETIRAGYPNEARLLDRGIVTADSLGLQGEGPWPVLFCGYLFHALDRPANTVREHPYDPVADDRFFPWR